MLSLGMQLDMGANMQKMGGNSGFDPADLSRSTFYWVHWYKYPVIYWLGLIINSGCAQGETFDISYLGELDPTWDDDLFDFILNPESILFGNVLAQLVCAADAIVTTAGGLPIDALFWCAGSQGSMYPNTGNTVHTFSEVSNGVLASERINFKLHRVGAIPETRGVWPLMCYQYYDPILPKSRYRYQYTGVISEPYMCHVYGASTNFWDAGKNNPATGENIGLLHWRKRNCCYY